MSTLRARSIYVAAPLAMAEVAKRVAVALSNAGHVICSRWHANGVIRESRDPMLRKVALADNLEGIENADAVVALTHIDLPRATYGEIAWALAKGKRVIWVQSANGDGANLFDAHENAVPLFVRHGSEEPGSPIDVFLEREMIEMIAEKLKEIA